MAVQSIKAKTKILIVDDVRANLIALSALLARDDVDVLQADSGNKALDLLMKHDFCLAFLDVQMPDMNGFELAELMRGAKRTMHVPIIFVTATAKDQKFSFKGYESGAVDFLLKPLDTHAVKCKANIFIDLYRQKLEIKEQLQTISVLVESLTAAKLEAEHANSVKSQFLANMSHEIRTPIGAILGFTDLMKNPFNTVEENQQFTMIVERSSQHLLRLIDDILDLAKVECGKLTIEAVTISFSEMLANFVLLMEIKAKEKGIEFILTFETRIPDKIMIDPLRLRQILSNIVGNAIKFTDHGHVEVKVAFTDPVLTFCVKDTGIGLSSFQAANIFKPFGQADSSTTRKFGGTGLGLVLSRNLAEILGGRLELAESATGIGSTFLIEVRTPLLLGAKLVGRDDIKFVGQSPVNFVPKTLALSGLAVLVVDDAPDNVALITAYLSREGATVKSASDGCQGVELALSEEYDVVLMDIQMPILGGHAATKKLRAANYLKPIIALTAQAMKEEQNKCFESGFTEFLTKPIQRNLLIEVMGRFVPVPAV
jgi:signal transduction histidine kinase